MKRMLQRLVPPRVYVSLTDRSLTPTPPGDRHRKAHPFSQRERKQQLVGCLALREGSHIANNAARRCSSCPVFPRVHVDLTTSSKSLKLAVAPSQEAVFDSKHCSKLARVRKVQRFGRLGLKFVVRSRHRSPRYAFSAHDFNGNRTFNACRARVSDFTVRMDLCV